MPRPPGNLLHPRHWPAWLLVGILWLLVRLTPWRWLIRLGEGLGDLLYFTLRSRREIALVNIRLCFPELQAPEQTALARAHFRAMGAAFFELLLSWWGQTHRLSTLARIEGMEHLHTALNRGKGVILLSAHFTTLEIAGRLLSLQQDFGVMYRPHWHPVIEFLYQSNRKRHYSSVIRSDQAREVIRALKRSEAIWYAPDQNFRSSGSVIVPFFGVPAPTNPATSRLARITGAAVVPFFSYRLPQGGYRLVIQPALEDFPGEGPEADAACVNRVIEAAVRILPEQYFWTHRRFKFKQHMGMEEPYRRPARDEAEKARRRKARRERRANG